MAVFIGSNCLECAGQQQRYYRVPFGDCKTFRFYTQSCTRAYDVCGSVLRNIDIIIIWKIATRAKGMCSCDHETFIKQKRLPKFVL